MSMIAAFFLLAEAAPQAAGRPQVAQAAASATVEVIRLERIADEPLSGAGTQAAWRSRRREADGSVLVSFE